MRPKQTETGPLVIRLVPHQFVIQFISSDICRDFRFVDAKLVALPDLAQRYDKH